MKTILYKLLFVTLLLPAVMLAATGKGKYTKEKKISRSFAVNANAGLNVASKYGNVYITTWDADRTEIDVVISVSGDNEDDVTKRLNGIDVDFDATRALVAAKTKIGNFSGKRTSMEINYTIKMPKNGTLGINNQYGDIKLGKVYGAINLSCQYGDVIIDELNSENNNLKLQYCSNSRINYIKGGDVDIQYSDLIVSKANILSLTSQYGDVNIGTLNNLTYKLQYGDLSIKSADKVTGTGSYSDVAIGAVENLLNTTTNYGDLNVVRIGKAVKNISINATYSDINIGYDEGAAFDFDLSGSYSDISVPGSFKVTEKTEKSSSSSYKGYYRSSGSARVYVKTMYGDIKVANSLKISTKVSIKIKS